MMSLPCSSSPQARARHCHPAVRQRTHRTPRRTRDRHRRDDPGRVPGQIRSPRRREMGVARRHRGRRHGRRHLRRHPLRHVDGHRTGRRTHQRTRLPWRRGHRHRDDPVDAQGRRLHLRTSTRRTDEGTGGRPIRGRVDGVLRRRPRGRGDRAAARRLRGEHRGQRLAARRTAHGDRHRRGPDRRPVLRRRTTVRRTVPPSLSWRSHRWHWPAVPPSPTTPQARSRSPRPTTAARSRAPPARPATTPSRSPTTGRRSPSSTSMARATASWARSRTSVRA